MTTEIDVILEDMSTVGVVPQVLTDENKEIMKNVSARDEKTNSKLVFIINTRCKTLDTVKQLYEFAPWNKDVFFSAAGKMMLDDVDAFIVEKMGDEITFLELEMIAMNSGNAHLVEKIIESKKIEKRAEDTEEAEMWLKEYSSVENPIRVEAIVDALVRVK